MRPTPPSKGETTESLTTGRGGGSKCSTTTTTLMERTDRDKVIASFLWAGVANDVYIAAEFDGWLQHKARSRTPTKSLWLWNAQLPPGSYKYKLLVDGEWRISDADLQAVDADGNPCNMKILLPNTAAPSSINTGTPNANSRNESPPPAPGNNPSLDPTGSSRLHPRLPVVQELLQPQGAVDSMSSIGTLASFNEAVGAPPHEACSPRNRQSVRSGKALSTRPTGQSVRSSQSEPVNLSGTAHAANKAPAPSQENFDSSNAQSAPSDRKSNRLSYMASKIVNRMSLKRTSGNYSANRRSRGKADGKLQEEAELLRAKEVAQEARGSWVGSNKVSGPVVFDDDAKSPEEADHKATELRKAGKTLQGWGDLRGASACYKKAVDVRENFYINSFEATELLLEHAHILSKLGDNDSAIEQLDRSLKIWERAPFAQKDRRADHLLYYAVILDRKKMTAEAEKFYHEAIGVYHRHKIQSDNLDIAYTNLNKNRKAQGKVPVPRRDL